MKNLFKAIVLLTNCFMLAACGQSVAVPSAATSATTTPIASPTAIPVTSVPSPTATATRIPTATQGHVRPTLIPTIDPALVPDLLSKAFSVQTKEGVNGHQIQQVTGWEYGFGGGFWEGSCSGYHWLDASHLLLYPQTGQVRAFDQWLGTGVVHQAVVINLENGQVWLPPANESASPLTCNRVYWSRELGILITSEINNDVSTVSTYTYDGVKLSSYRGGLWGVSPSGTKVLIAKDTLIDLRANKRIYLVWPENDNEQQSSRLYWNMDETRVYRCCYYFADTSTGQSYSFELSDLRQPNGEPGPSSILPHAYGQWVRGGTYFLVEWSWIDDGDIRYLPMFDPAKKRFYDVRQMVEISEDWSCQQTRVSPDGTFVWMTGWGEEGEGSYLVNLFTFESQYYPGREYLNIDWSPNGKFAWLFSSDPAGKTKKYSILSVEDKEIRPVPIPPLQSGYWWNGINDILVYPSEDKKSLIFLNAATMSFQELPISAQRATDLFVKPAWSPNGEKITFAAEDSSIWRVDYPVLENLEQLTPSFPDVHDVNWSPDGKSIAFVSGSEIYIVDTMK